jgi:hypothetical protein
MDEELGDKQWEQSAPLPPQHPGSGIGRLSGTLPHRTFGAPGRPDGCPGDAALAPVQPPIRCRAPRGQRASPAGGERRYGPSREGRSPGKA